MNFYKKYLSVTCCLFLMAPQLKAQDVINLTLQAPLLAKQSAVFPVEVNAAVGHEVHLKLRKSLTNQQACTVTTAGGHNFTTSSLPDPRFEAWGEGCGIRIKNIQHSDEGRWRLTASRDDHTITGFSTIRVFDSTTITASPITLSDGSANQKISLTNLAHSYCMVTKPFATRTLVPGYCEVEVPLVSRALQGTWNIQLGLSGQVEEVPFETTVVVQAESLDTGYVHDSHAQKLHLHCNLLHTNNTVSFCRFQRTDNTQGYNVKDGLGDGHYSYYGDGFELNECGMTIEHPEAQHFTAWRCSVGVVRQDGVLTVMQGLVSVTAMMTESNQLRHRSTRSDDNEMRSILAVNNTELTVSCESDFPLAYCWFRLENEAGARDFTMTTRVEGEVQEFWFSGGFDTGDCAITFPHATPALSGDWTCHMGPTNLIGLEITNKVKVRVTGHLAATEQVVVGRMRESVVLRCRTAGATRPLDYCRFLSPASLGLNFASTVTYEKAILGRYYFASGADLDQGDCSLAIGSIQSEDIGVWTCAAIVSGETEESFDTITLANAETLSVASMAGIGAGALLLVLAIALYGTVVIFRKPSQSSRTENLPMHELSRPRDSNGSSESGGSVTHFTAGDISSHDL